MNDKEFYSKLVELKGGIPEPLNETASVLCYESGLVLKYSMFAKWATEREDFREATVYKGLIKSELMDVIAQSVLMAESMGCKFEELKEMGFDKACERFKEGK